VVTFSGTGKWLQASDAGLPAGAETRTVSLWAKQAAPSGNGVLQSLLLYGTEGETGEAFWIAILTDQYLFSQNGDALFGSSVALGEWHMITVTVSDTGFVRLIKDDLVSMSYGYQASMGTVLGGSPALRLGANQSGSDNCQKFSGQLDDVVIYAGVLSDAEIAARFAATTAAHATP
jgi:hypothetical protein